MADELMGRRIAILTTNGMEQAELTEPRRAVEEAGAAAELLSSPRKSPGDGNTRSIDSDIRNAGGEWVDETIVVDDGLISSRDPDDPPAFCGKVVEAPAT